MARGRPGPRCPICSHADRDAIDLALATGVESRAEIARRYALDRTAAYRHATGGHMDDRLVDHAAEAATEAAEQLLDRVVALADRLDRRLAARDVGDGSDGDVARLARELRAVFDLLARVSGKLIDRVEVRSTNVGRWSDVDVVRVLDGVLAAIEDEWPDACDAARAVVAAALSDVSVGVVS